MRGILASLLSQTDRWPLWLPVLFGLGIGIYFALPSEPPLWGGLLLAGACGFFYLSFRFSAIIAYSALVILVTSFGFSAAQWRTHMVSAPVLAKKIGPVTVTGRLIRVDVRPDGRRLTLEEPRITNLRQYETPKMVRIKVRGKASPPTQESAIGEKPGDWLEVRAILSPPMPPTAPGGFDFQRYAFFHRLGAVGFSVGDTRILKRGEEFGSLSLALSRLRARTSDKIRQQLPGDSGGVVAALMTGERGGISDDALQSIRNAGLAHLLAISGLHIGLIAAFVFFGLRYGMAMIPPLALSFPIKKWAAVGALGVAFFYAILVGATVPTQRAFLMISIVFLAVLFDRQGISMRTLAIAALAVLLFQPESLVSASFQMSFAAVTMLIAVYERLVARRAARERGRSKEGWGARGWDYLLGVALTTIIATVATTPFALYHFNQLAVYGLFANLLAVPVMALMEMPLIAVAWLAVLLDLDVFLYPILGIGVDIILGVANFFSQVKGAVLIVKTPETLFVSIITLAGLWMCIWKGPAAFAAFPVMILGVIGFLNSPTPFLVIDEKGDLLGLFTDRNPPMLSDLRKSKRAREDWLSMAGYSGTVERWPLSGQGREAIRCDSQGCLIKVGSTHRFMDSKGNDAEKVGNGTARVAIAHDVAALIEDCFEPLSLLVSRVPIRRDCPGPNIVVDRFDLWRKGSHAFWLKGGGVEVKTVADVQGDRPWSSYARRKSKKTETDIVQ